LEQVTHIFIRTLTGKAIFFGAEETDTIAKVKDLIFEMEGIE
jgi:hypothetical protein